MKNLIIISIISIFLTGCHSETVRVAVKSEHETWHPDHSNLTTIRHYHDGHSHTHTYNHIYGTYDNRHYFPRKQKYYRYRY